MAGGTGGTGGSPAGISGTSGSTQPQGTQNFIAGGAGGNNRVAVIDGASQFGPYGVGGNGSDTSQQSGTVGEPGVSGAIVITWGGGVSGAATVTYTA